MVKPAIKYNSTIISYLNFYFVKIVASDFQASDYFKLRERNVSVIFLKVGQGNLFWCTFFFYFISSHKAMDFRMNLSGTHCRAVQSECVHFFESFLLENTVCWNLAYSTVHLSKGLDWSFCTSWNLTQKYDWGEGVGLE